MENKKNNKEAAKEIFSLEGVSEKRLASILRQLKSGKSPDNLFKVNKEIYDKFPNEIDEYLKTSSAEDVKNIVFSIDGVNQSDLDNLISETLKNGSVPKEYLDIYNENMDAIDSHIDSLVEEVSEEISDMEHDAIDAEKNADLDGRDDAEKDDLKKSKKSFFNKGKEFFQKHFGKTEQEKLDKIERDKNKDSKKSQKTKTTAKTNSKNPDQDGVSGVDGRTLGERKTEAYEKLGYKFDATAHDNLRKDYLEKMRDAKKEGNSPDEKKYKKLLGNVNNELFERQMSLDLDRSGRESQRSKFEDINSRFAKMRMEGRKLGQIKNVLSLVDAESFGKKTEVKGKFPKRMLLKVRNYMNSTDEKNGLVKSYNWVTGRGTNKDFHEKLVEAQKLIGKDTASLTPEEAKLLKSIDLKRLSGALNEDTTRTSFDNTADGGDYKGTEITDSTKADFTKKMEQIQQLDSRAMKMEGWNVKNRLKIWVENPANIRRLKSKLRIGIPAALLTGGLSNVGFLGSLGMFGVRAAGALGGGEIFKGAYKKFATMPYQERAWNMRKEMQKNGDYLKNAQAGDIDSAVAKKIKKDNFGQMAAYVPGAIAGALAGGGLAEMQNGGEFLDPTKRLLKMPGKAASFVKGLFTGETNVEGGSNIGNSNGVKTPESFVKAKDTINSNNEIIKKFKDSLANTRGQLDNFKKSEIDLKEKLESLKLKPVDSLENQVQIADFQKQLDSIKGSNVELQARIDDDALKLKQAEDATIKAEQDLDTAENELKKDKSEIKNNEAIENKKTSPYEDFIKDYTVEESSKIRKNEGIYHALMRQTGNDKARVMALLKKHDYIKFDASGKLIKDVRVKDGMGAAYDIVTIDGKETIIESVNGNPCHCDEFDVVEVKKACDANDLTTGKLERQEYVHSYKEQPKRPKTSVRVPETVGKEFEQMQNEIRITEKTIIEKHYYHTNTITNTEYIKSDPEIVYKYIEDPEMKKKISELEALLLEKKVKGVAGNSEIKINKKREHKFLKWLGRLGTDVLANEITYQIHKGDHGQDIIVCQHPNGETVDTGYEITGGHNTANGETGNTGNTNQEVTGGSNTAGGRRTGNGRSVPSDLEGRGSRETTAERLVRERNEKVSSDRRSKSSTRGTRQRTTRETSARKGTSNGRRGTSTRSTRSGDSSSQRTTSRATRSTNSSPRRTSSSKSGGVRGRSNRSGR